MTNRRAYPRVDFFTPVRLQESRAIREATCLSANLSLGGIFLWSQHLLPRGSQVALEFRCRDRSVLVDCAEIVWSRPIETVDVDTRVPGMAARFIQLDDQHESRIATFVSDSLLVTDLMKLMSLRKDTDEATRAREAALLQGKMRLSVEEALEKMDGIIEEVRKLTLCSSS
jgi:hypothetical protein